MKSKLTTIYLIAGIAILSSCRKIEDVLEKKTYDKCVLSTISFSPDTNAEQYSSELNRVLYFNSVGEPTKSIPQNDFTGNSNFAFTYDAQGNLKYFFEYYIFDFIPSTDPYPSNPPYQNVLNNIQAYHSYGHNSKGQITSDTAYLLFTTPRVRLTSVTNYEYDVVGRMTAAIRLPYNTDGTIDSLGLNKTEYKYDGQGNLIGHGPYDNETSWKSKSKVLQFILRDYSVNNPLTTSNQVISYEYNTKHLPASATGGTIFDGILGPITKGKNTFTYNCK